MSNKKPKMRQISMVEISSEEHGAKKAYSVEVIRGVGDSVSDFYSLNIYCDHDRVMDYSGIGGDLPMSVAFFLKGQGFDVSLFA